MSDPFVGPKPFDEKNVIYGRDLEIAELRYFLGSKRIVVLYSPSGAGKSSLLNARNGLVNKLRESGRFDVWGPARLNSRPEHPDVNRFSQSLIAGLGGSREQSRLTLAEFVRARQGERNPLLIVDQFEEILRLDPANTKDKHAFFDQLGELLYQPEVWALLVLREDYLAAFQPYVRQVPTHLQNRFRIDFLRRADQARAAVIEPLRAQNRTFASDAVVDNMLANLAKRTLEGKEVIGETVEPLQLQVVCQNLWTRISSRDPAVPIVDKDIGDPSRALAEYYRAKVKRESTEAERQIRDWFDDALITEDGARKLIQVEAVSAAGMPLETLKELEDAYLVRRERRADGGAWIELSHDRLVPPIREDNRDWRSRNLSTLQKAADFWQDKGRLPDLLLRGASLEEAQEWAGSNPLQPFEKEFLKQSERAEDVRRWTRIFRIAIAALGVAAIVTGIWAWQKRGEALAAQAAANQQRNLAESARGDAERATKRATEKEAEARANLVASDLARVLQLTDEQNWDEAMAYLARALRSDPDAPGPRMWVAGLISRAHPRIPLFELAHDAAVTYTAFGPRANRALTVQRSGRDSAVSVWDPATGARIGPALALPYWVTAARLGFGGEVLTIPITEPEQLAAEPKGAVSLWRLRGGRWIETPIGAFQAGGVSDGCFAPDGRGSLILLLNGAFARWDPRTKEIAAIQGPNGEGSGGVFDLALSRDGRHLAGSTPERLLVFDLTTGALKASIRQDSKATFFSWDSRKLFSIDTREKEHLWQVWDLESMDDDPIRGPADGFKGAVIGRDGRLRIVLGETLQTWGLSRPNDNLRADTISSGEALFSSDGRLLAMRDGRGIVIHDTAGSHFGAAPPGADLRHSGELSTAAFSPDGRMLIAGSPARQAVLYSSAVGQLQNRVLAPGGRLNDLAFTAKSGLLAIATSNGAALWDPSGERPDPVPLVEGALVAKVMPQNDSVFTASWNEKARQWEAQAFNESGARISAKPMTHAGRITQLAASGDGRRLFTGSNDRTGRIWDSASGEPLTPPLWHGAPVSFATFAPDGSRVIAAAGDRVFEWDLTGKLLRVSRPYGERISAAALGPAGNFLILGFSEPDGVLGAAVHGLRGLIPGMREMEGQPGPVRFAAVSGVRGLTVSGDTGLLWDLREALPLALNRKLNQRAEWTAAVFNANGRYLLSGAADGSGELWDTQSGIPVGYSFFHEGAIEHAAISAEAAAFAVRNHVHVWPLQATFQRGAAIRNYALEFAALAEFAGGLRLGAEAGSFQRIPLAERQQGIRELQKKPALAGSDVQSLIARIVKDSGL
jgi:WD40 repeat protein/energy-coupling factor transporter ATP-binding protein EcfA2